MQRGTLASVAAAEDKDHPKLLPEELDVVRRTILHTVLPLWIDRVPHNLGSATHRSLKAAEWLILYKVYYPVALIPLWVKSLGEAATPESKQRILALLESTSTLGKIAHFLTLPSIHVRDLRELDSLILSYRNCLQKGWPGKTSKPNLHLTQHFSDVIRRFGPPRSTAAWVQERVNGMLQRLTTNHHLDDIPRTLLHKWHINSNSCLPRRNTQGLHSSEGVEEDTETPVKLTLDQPTLQKWKRAVCGKEGTRAKLELTPAMQNLNPTVEVLRSFQINRKTFTAVEHHEGNSMVEFHLGKDQRFGQIEHIFESDQTPQQRWFIVNPFKELQRLEDPYGDYPDLNCCLVRDNHDASVVVKANRVIGHAAMTRNIGGTFGIAAKTISAVGLGTAVSDLA
ncbi:hypothetical protein PTTG_30464 [Puccinia triticina 1-1 BBBD Race 1]|uniref:Uncharacterized protein n=1 Tax=Puccinia triticina (isolate 1-1 / race 1 (BBBD)) TaxID=630390 RepID=A0A180FYQ5_PUCT1|nr:hypothetical protein PTTG_30464 [Puccinia triticina 1-1 BBBD Race 1]